MRRPRIRAVAKMPKVAKVSDGPAKACKLAFLVLKPLSNRMNIRAIFAMVLAVSWLLKVKRFKKSGPANIPIPIKIRRTGMPNRVLILEANALKIMRAPAINKKYEFIVYKYKKGEIKKRTLINFFFIAFFRFDF